MNQNDNGVNKSLKKEKTERSKRKFFERRSSWYLLGILLFVLVVALGALLGVFRGINDRVKLAEAQAAPKIRSQIESTKLDLEEGRFEVALGRLDWLLDEMSEQMSDEEMAEVGELYSQALLLQTTYKTPTPQPSPTPTEPAYTPTPDLRGAEELFDTAKQQIADGLWDEAIQTIEALRHKNLDFRTIQVDGMLYVALRNRGVQKILVEGSLEPGIYDLSLAERFAPLDNTAEGLRIWTRLYLTGSSYWEVDWAQVVHFFGQVYPHLPNLRDGTFMTATERYRIGAIEYAYQLAGAGQFCEAQEYIERAVEMGSDSEVQENARWIAEECWKLLHPPTEPPVDEPTPTPTPTPAEDPDEPTATPTEESTQTPTEEPAD